MAGNSLYILSPGTARLTDSSGSTYRPELLVTDNCKRLKLTGNTVLYSLVHVTGCRSSRNRTQDNRKGPTTKSTAESRSKGDRTTGKTVGDRREVDRYNSALGTGTLRYYR